jgi:hypothetical protein
MRPMAAAARPMTASGPSPCARNSRTPVSPADLLSFSPLFPRLMGDEGKLVQYAAKQAGQHYLAAR